MDPKAILSDLLVYYLVLAVAINGVALSIAKCRDRRYLPYYIWLNVGVLLLFVVGSWLRQPAMEALKFDVTFYALREAEESDSKYLQWSLQNQGGPGSLGTRDALGRLDRPIGVAADDEAQMRVRLNHEGYVHISHFDTSFQIKQLYPNPTEGFQSRARPGTWLECPPGLETWVFDETKGLEVFVLVVSLSPAPELVVRIGEIVAHNRLTENTWAERDSAVIEELRLVAPCSYVKNDVYVNDCIHVEPARITASCYVADNEEFAVLVVPVRNE